VENGSDERRKVKRWGGHGVVGMGARARPTT